MVIIFCIRNIKDKKTVFHENYQPIFLRNKSFDGHQ